MDVARLRSALMSVSQEIDTINTQVRLRELSARISALIPAQSERSPDSSETIGYKECWNSLRDDLQLCNSNFGGATRRLILKETGATNLTGTGLIDRIEDIFRESNVNPTDAVAALDKLSDEVGGFCNRVGRLNEDLAALGVGVERLEPGQCEIVIHIPIKDGTGSMEELGGTVQEFHQHMRPLTRVAGEGEPQEIAVSTLSSPGWQLFLNVDLMSVVVFSVVMKGISEIRCRLEQRREIRKNTEALYPAYVLEEMDRADAELFAAEYRRIAEEVVGEYHRPKKGSAEELKSLMTETVKFIAGKIEENVVFGFQAEPEKEISDQDRQDRPEEASQLRKRIENARKVNLLSGTLLAIREGRAVPQVLSRAVLSDAENKEKAVAASN